jgi:hypothetical protein
MSASFVSPGSPDYDYHLDPMSAAVDQAVGSSVAEDMDCEPRPSSAWPDIGADEYMQPALLLQPPYRADQSLALAWKANLNLMAELDHFNLVVLCEPGARPPDQGPCDAPFGVGLQVTFTLTGLTNGREYIVMVEARDSSDNLIATSNSAVGIPRDIVARILVPMLFGED